jgi:hypothetical protein
LHMLLTEAVGITHAQTGVEQHIQPDPLPCADGPAISSFQAGKPSPVLR